jgi:hypothetical protein
MKRIRFGRAVRCALLFMTLVFCLASFSLANCGDGCFLLTYWNDWTANADFITFPACCCQEAVVNNPGVICPVQQNFGGVCSQPNDVLCWFDASPVRCCAAAGLFGDNDPGSASFGDLIDPYSCFTNCQS